MTGKRPGRVLHVITGLGTGGAERALVETVTRLDPERWRSTVLALGDLGPFAARLRERGIDVRGAGMPPGRPTLAGVRAVVGAACRDRAELVQGWMYHGNLAATLAAARVDARTVWNVRQTLASPESERAGTELVIRVCARVSRAPAAIVYNSAVAARQHESIGFAADRRAVIPNGFDTDRFRPDAAARIAVRAELGLGPDAPVAGCVARMHPVKDHATLFAAFRQVRAARPDAVLVLVGAGTESAALRWRADVGAGVVGLGEREDVARVLAAVDVHVLASRAEALPNAVGEAMATGLPCVATAVGDVGEMIGDTGRIVPAGRPEALARAWLDVLGWSPERRRASSRSARERIERRYAADTSAAAYDRLYSAILARGTA